METATVTPAGPEAPSAAVTPPTGPMRRRLGGVFERSRRLDLLLPALIVLLAATLALRLWGVKTGLPYSYNSDEATHFVPRAVGFFSHDLNPHYFLNPPGYTYLLYIVFELWFGSADAVMRTYAANPTEVYVVARVVVAVLGTLSVWLTYLAGSRFFNRSVGLLAAAIFGLAFLPIFYSHLALNDVPTLAPVALALYASAGVMRRGRRRDYVLAGVAVGLAAATKYTGAFTAFCLCVAAFCDATDGSIGPAARRLGLAVAAGGAAFVLANPYAVLHFSAFASGVSQQASLAAGSDPVKLGTRAGNGIVYYLWTFTWGLGWGPALAAIAGAVLLVVRRRIGLALCLIPVCIAFIVFMGDQQRYFGRWLMPIFPIVALLAAYAGVEAVRWLARAWAVPAVVGGAVAAVLLLGQSLVAVIHNDAALSRADTRNLARAWMVAHVPAGSRVVIEPLVPDSWANDVGRSLSATYTGERWLRYPTWLTDVDSRLQPLPAGEVRYVVVDQYERVLRPQLLNEYVAGDFCWVVLGSLQAGRAFAQPQDAPEAVAYYNDLAERARLVYHVSPFGPGGHPVPFSFDWSIDYYPRQYRRPGPEMSVYHLRGGRCGR